MVVMRFLIRFFLVMFCCIGVVLVGVVQVGMVIVIGGVFKIDNDVVWQWVVDEVGGVGVYIVVFVIVVVNFECSGV